MLALEQTRQAARLFYDADAILKEVEKNIPDQLPTAKTLVKAFLDAEHRYRSLQMYDQNAALYQERKEKPKRATYMGGMAVMGGANGRMPAGAVATAFYRLDSASGEDDWKTEKRDTQEGWDRVGEKKLMEAQTRLLDAMEELKKFLEGYAVLDSFLKSYPVRFSRHKYEEAVRLTREFKPADNEFRTGMEYFARLDSRRDAKTQFSLCNRALHWYQTKMALKEVPVAMLITMGVFILVNIPFTGYQWTGASVIDIILAILLSAVAGAVISIPIQLVIQVVLLIQTAGRYKKMQTEHPYTAEERLWELD